MSKNLSLASLNLASAFISFCLLFILFLLDREIQDVAEFSDNSLKYLSISTKYISATD
nr:MAG TPA: hypothetical protein [Bacteriophage sp.]